MNAISIIQKNIQTALIIYTQLTFHVLALLTYLKMVSQYQ